MKIKYLFVFIAVIAPTSSLLSALTKDEKRFFTAINRGNTKKVAQILYYNKNINIEAKNHKEITDIIASYL